MENTKHQEHPYDLHAKGLKYDALKNKTVDHINDLLDKDEEINTLKKRNDELVEALEDIKLLSFESKNQLIELMYKQCNKALKNNSND